MGPRKEVTVDLALSANKAKEESSTGACSGGRKDKKENEKQEAPPNASHLLAEKTCCSFLGRL